MHDIVIRLRQAADLDDCVEALRAVHDTDAYPLRWPPDPHGWLTPPRLLRAWIAECPPGTIAGHIAVQRPAATTVQRTAATASFTATADGTTATTDGTSVAADGPTAEVSRLYVAPAARRHRVATALLRQVRSWAAAHHLRLTLNVPDGHRSTAVAFYEAGGWRHTHTTDADWTAPDGSPVRLRHYVLSSVR